MARAAAPAPNQVFTPGEIPSEDTNVYVSRQNAEASIQRGGGAALGSYRLWRLWGRQDLERPTGGTIQNITSFRDPMMKSFVKFVGTLSGAGLLPESDTLTIEEGQD